MSPDLIQAIESTLETFRGTRCSVVDVASVSGGCINRSYRVTMRDGEPLFVKANDGARFEMFAREQDGLERLAAASVIRIPRIVALGKTSRDSFLVLEWIEPGTPSGNYSQQMGHALGETHRQRVGDRFGLDDDNYLGSTAQPNGWSNDWVSFWAEQRLGFQIKLAVDAGLDSGALSRLGRKLIGRLDTLIQMPEEPPVLIHGDLWSGNHLCDSQGNPVLIDPAVYYGCREAEFGMTTLFGGFDDLFYAAYNEVWPLADGHAERIEIYRLYHLLNHLNLFGRSYLSDCLDILKKYE